MFSHKFGRYRFALMASCLFLAGSAVAPRAEAFQLPAPSYPKEISAGLLHACALFNTGGVKCWGKNTEGEVGFSYVNMPNTNLPVSVQLKGPARAISSGSAFSCALLDSGEVQCWGTNKFGQIGASNSGAFPIGAPVPLAGPAIAIASGWAHTCAIVKMPASTGVQCWGNNNYWQLGNSAVADFSQIPQGVPNMTGATSIAAGEGHTCVTTIGGTDSGTKCWGHNYSGQLGRGSFTAKELPGPVVNHVAYSSLAAGRSSKSTCGLDGEALYCWGENTQGELGFGVAGDVAMPTAVLASNSVTAFAGLWFFSDSAGCILDSKKLYCSGHADAQSTTGKMFGEISSDIPTAVPNAPPQINAMSISEAFACFVVPTQVAFNAGVQCMGAGLNGELGNGQYASSSVPVNVKF